MQQWRCCPNKETLCPGAFHDAKWLLCSRDATLRISVAKLALLPFECGNNTPSNNCKSWKVQAIYLALETWAASIIFLERCVQQQPSLGPFWHWLPTLKRDHRQQNTWMCLLFFYGVKRLICLMQSAMKSVLKIIDIHSLKMHWWKGGSCVSIRNSSSLHKQKAHDRMSTWV